MTTTPIALNKLVLSPLNVRQTGTVDDTSDLEGSIVAHGLLAALTAHPMPRGKFGVIAGGRRLLALQRLAAAGKIAKDEAIDVSVRDEDNATATEISVIENTARVALPAAEELAAFARLATEGRDVAEIATRFGTTELHVRQRLRLAQLHPDILAALGAGRLTLDIAKIYAATADQALQKRIWDQGHSHPYEVRAALKRDAVSAGVERMLGLVTMDEYATAGGRAEEDLFSTGESRIMDVDLLRGLYDAKLQAQRDALDLPGNVTLQFDAGGLGYPVEINDDLDKDQHARRVEIDDRLEDIETTMDQVAEYDADAPIARWVAIAGEEQGRVDNLVAERGLLVAESEAIAASAGVPDGPLIAVASVADGKLKVGQYFRPLGWREDAVDTGGASLTTIMTPRPAAKAEPAEREVINGFRADRAGMTHLYRQPEEVARDEHGLTKDALDVMRSHHRQILAGALLSEPLAERLAGGYLIYVLARGMFRREENGGYTHDFYVGGGTQGMLGVDRLPSHDADPHHARADLADQPAAAVQREAIERLRAAPWMIEPDPAQGLRMFVHRPMMEREHAAACVATAMLSRSVGITGFGIGVHDVLADLLNIGSNVRDHFSPDKAFFSRLPKNRKLDALRAVDPALATRLGSLGTDDLSAAAAAVMRGDRATAEKYGMTREAVQRAQAWVPAYLSFEPVLDDPQDDESDEPPAPEVEATARTVDGSPADTPSEFHELARTGKHKHLGALATIELVHTPAGWRTRCSYAFLTGSMQGRKEPLAEHGEPSPTREAAIGAAAARLRMMAEFAAGDPGMARELRAIRDWCAELATGGTDERLAA